MHAVAFAARKLRDLFLLIRALKIEGRGISARIDLALAEIENLVAARNFFPNGFLAVERIARLIDIAEANRFADFNGALVWLLLPRDHAKKRGLARPVRADDADDAAGRQFEREIVDQELVAKAFGKLRECDDVGAEALGNRNEDLRSCGRLFVLLGEELLIAPDAGFCLGLARLGACGDPIGLGLELALARFLLAALLRQP